MKWVAISGSWRKTNKKVENDVREQVRKIINNGNGIVFGGALNVDYFATDEAMKLDKNGQKIKIFLPTTLKIYTRHYRKRAQEGVITKQQAEHLTAQLESLQRINSLALIENKNNKVVDQKTYFERNSALIQASDELIAFCVNKSKGVKDTINKAKVKGIPVKIFNYTIE